MTRTKQEFNKICASFEQALPDSYAPAGEVEEFHRKFVNESESRTVSLLWLENDSDSWFEIDGYEDGEITGSETVEYDTLQVGEYESLADNIDGLFAE